MASFGLTKELKMRVVALLSGAILVVLNATLLSPGLPAIMADLQVDATTVQWLISAYTLTEAVVIPLAAWFLGRLSTRALFLGGMALFGAGSLVAALAPIFLVLLLGRIMQAMAAGVLMTAVMSLILLTFPREMRGGAMGIVGLVIGFAPAIGPTLGGILVDAIGWRALFALIVGLVIIVLIFASRVLTNYEGFHRTHFDVITVVFSTIGLASLLYGLSSFASSNHIEVCIALMIVGVIFIGLFARRQFKLDEPVLRLEVLKSRRYRTAVITSICLQAALIGLGVLMPLYIQNVLGYSATVSGLVTLPGAVLGAFAGLFAGKVFDRYGVRIIALVGAFFLLVSGVGMFMYNAYSPLIFVVIVNIVNGISIQLLMTPTNTWGVNSLDNELVQHATSVTNTANMVGGSFGTALIMSISALGTSISTSTIDIERVFDGYHLSFTVTLAFLTVLFLVAVFCIRNRKTDRVPNSAPVSVKKEGQYRVSEVMNTEALTIPVTATMSDATRALAKTGDSGAVIVDEDNMAKGFISNSDIIRYFSDETDVVSGLGFTAIRALDNEDVRDRIARMSNINVMEVATKGVIHIEPNALFEEACTMLAEKRLKELPVVHEGKLLGVVHRQDLMDFLADTLEQEQKAAQQN